MRIELRTRAVRVTGSRFLPTPYRNEFWVYNIHTDQGEVSIFAEGPLPNLHAAMRDPVEVISMECDADLNTTSITRETENV